MWIRIMARNDHQRVSVSTPINIFLYRVLHGDRTLPFIRWCYIFWNQSYVLSIVLSMLYQPMISKLTFDLSKGLLITKKVRKFRMFTFWVAGAWNIYCDVRFHVRELEIFPDVNKLRRYYNNIDFDFDIVVIRTKKDFDSGLKDDRAGTQIWSGTAQTLWGAVAV